nr:hypothetical protein [Tanacetum cinerariifolium]
DLAFCLEKILRFVFRRSCILSSEDLAFCLQKILHFVFKDLAFCLRSTAFCLLPRSCVLSQKHCVLSLKILRFDSVALRFVSDLLRFFLRYIDTRLNGEALRKCILSGPYKPTTILVQAVVATDDSLAIPEHTTEMWEAIERLQQGESLNIQDVKTNLFWEFEWSMFVTIVKKQHKLDEVSYHKLFDILKQYQKQVKELRAERLARNANPLALVATAQANQDSYYQTSKSHKSYAPSSKPSIPTRSHTTTRHKGKEIAKPITPPFEIASEEDSDPEQAQRDKDMNKNVDTTLRYKNDNQSGQFRNQRTVSVAGLGKMNPESQKGLKTLRITRKRCCCANKLSKVQNEAGYNIFANELQHSEQSESISNTCLVETNDSNVIPDSPDMCEDDIHNDQNDVESDDERVALVNLIANLKLNVEENKKIQKQLKKANPNTYSGIERVQSYSCGN